MLPPPIPVGVRPMFEWLFGKKAAPRRKMPTISGVAGPGGGASRPAKVLPRKEVPTVSFDSSRVTPLVRADLEATLRLIADIPSTDFDRIHRASLESVSRGRDLQVVAQALLTIDGITKKRAGAIARLVNNRATSIMDRQRQLGLGMKQGIWRYSGASCSDADDDVHSRLDGKKYSLEKGMAVGKHRVWPGMQEECKCGSSPIIPGFDQ